GSVDELNRGDLLGFICNSTQISGKSIGKIDLKGVFSFFEVENDLVEKVYAGFKTVDFKGREVRIENAGARQSSGGGNRSRGNSSHSRPRNGGTSRPSNGGGYNRDRSSGSGDSNGRRSREKQDSGF